jgi:hypothetical protein
MKWSGASKKEELIKLYISLCLPSHKNFKISHQVISSPVSLRYMFHIYVSDSVPHKAVHLSVPHCTMILAML